MLAVPPASVVPAAAALSTAASAAPKTLIVASKEISHREATKVMQKIRALYIKTKLTHHQRIWNLLWVSLTNISPAL